MTAPSNQAKFSKPSKPHPEFPLFAHNCGQWAKKIKGQIRYFGTWDNPDAALKLYLKEKDTLLAGVVPSRDGCADVETVFDHYLHECRQRVDAGDLTMASFDDYLRLGKTIATHLGVSASVSSLGPEQFSKFRNKIVGKYSPSRASKIIVVTRQVFKWAYESELIDSLPRFGPGFKVVSKKQHRLHKSESDKKLFSQDNIKALLGVSNTKWKAIILLGINCGVGNTDISQMEFGHLDLESGWLDYSRRKTGISRRVPLWDETVEAINRAIKDRPSHKPGCESLVFLTAHGSPMIEVTDRGTKKDQVSQNFRKMVKDSGVGSGGFYWLRHTFQTIGDEAKDPVAVSAIMGHVDGSMAGNYREAISGERLRVVVNHVRGWLQGK